MQEVTFWDVFCDFVKTRMTVEENKTEIDELLDDPVETGIREESVTQGASWSADLPKIKKAIRTKKLKAEPESLASEFNSISLQNQGITKTGKEIGKLKNLKSLSLSVNNLKYVDNLPNLSILNVYGNHIESMEGCTFPTSLVHLGIGFNQISTLKISASSLPELISLDLSWNQLHDLHAVLDAVKALPKLRQLTLLGNPFCLMTNYRNIVAKALPNIVRLDDRPLEPHEPTTLSKECTIRVAFDYLNNKEKPLFNAQTETSLNALYQIEFKANEQSGKSEYFPMINLWPIEFSQEFKLPINGNSVSIIRNATVSLIKTTFSDSFFFPENSKVKANLVASASGSSVSVKQTQNSSSLVPKKATGPPPATAIPTQKTAKSSLPPTTPQPSQQQLQVTQTHQAQPNQSQLNPGGAAPKKTKPSNAPSPAKIVVEKMEEIMVKNTAQHRLLDDLKEHLQKDKHPSVAVVGHGNVDIKAFLEASTPKDDFFIHFENPLQVGSDPNSAIEHLTINSKLILF